MDENPLHQASILFPGEEYGYGRTCSISLAPVCLSFSFCFLSYYSFAACTVYSQASQYLSSLIILFQQRHGRLPGNVRLPLFDNITDHAGADGAPALADREPEVLLHRDRLMKLHFHASRCRPASPSQHPPAASSIPSRPSSGSKTAAGSP